PHRVSDLTPTPIPDGDVDNQSRIAGRGLLRLLERTGRRIGQDVERTDGPGVPSLLTQAHDRFFDDAYQRTEFVLGTGEVVGGQHPQGDHPHTEFVTPTEQFEDLVRTGTVSLFGGPQATVLGPATVSVHDDTDVSGNFLAGQLTFQPALVQPVQGVTEPHGRNLSSWMKTAHSGNGCARECIQTSSPQEAMTQSRISARAYVLGGYGTSRSPEPD